MTNGELMVAIFALLVCLEIVAWWNVVAGPRSIRLPSLLGAVVLLFGGATVGSVFAQSGAFGTSYESSPAAGQDIFLVGACLTVAVAVIIYRVSGALQRRRQL